MKAVSVVSVGCVLFGCALYGMSAEKMRVTEICRDARLYMDGGIDASIESGGLNFHRTLKIYRKHLRDEMLIGTIDLKSEISSKGSQDVYGAGNVKLTVNKDRAPGRFGFPSRLTAQLPGERVDVAMNCMKK